MNEIYNYTDGSYEWINELLRNNDGVILDESILKLCTQLSNLPDYQEVVFRGANLWKNELDKYVDALHTETEVKEYTFISASRSPSIAKEFVYVGKIKNNVFFEIASRSGKLIEAYSAHPHEKEVLFMPNTIFSVEEIEYKDEWVVIKLMEVESK